MLPDVSATLARHFDAGDWLFLLLLAKNMPRAVYRPLAAEVANLLARHEDREDREGSSPKGPRSPKTPTAPDSKELDPLVPLDPLPLVVQPSPL